MRVAAHERGSVLIEALVAVLILAALSGVWFNTIAGSVQRQRALTGRAMAMLVASSQLATVGVLMPVAPGTRSGRDGDYAWAIAIESAAGSGRLARVEVTVSDAQGKPLAHLSTLRTAA